jgi:Cdc6-like AAA superfamily ATPase
MANVKQLMATDRLNKWFTPNKPIDLPEYLSGRMELIYRIQDAINTQGQHIILYGDRGIGKTSLARVVAVLVQEPEKREGRRVILVSGDSNETFSSLWRKAFQEILLSQRQLGLNQKDIFEIVGSLDVGDTMQSPNDVRLYIKSLPFPVVIIIDEFDRVPSRSNTRRLLADTIKLLSDTGVSSTIMLVGVAETMNELFGEHQSIARNIAQILVEPMDVNELAEIIQKGYTNCNFSYEEGLDRKIAVLSQGYPHYTHLLGLWAGRQAINSKRDRVTHKDLDDAIPKALQNAAGGIIHEYDTATDSNQPDNLFKDVLLACAIAEKDHRGRFRIKSLKEPLRKILNRPTLQPVAYQRHLAMFCENKRGAVLKRTGSKRNYHWQFTNPQLIPYVRLDGINRGKIQAD